MNLGKRKFYPVRTNSDGIGLDFGLLSNKNPRLQGAVFRSGL